MQTNVGGKFGSYLVPFGSILLVLVLVPTVVLPQIQKIRDNLQVIDQNSERLEKLKTKSVALAQLASAQDELDRKLAIAESALPIEKDVARLIRGVQGLASASGLEPTKVEIKPGKTATDSAKTTAKEASAQGSAGGNQAQTTATTTSANKNELLFEMTLKGNLASYQSFLKSIESTKRLLILSSSKGSSDSGTDYTFVIVISAPFGPLPQISQDQLAEAIADLSANNEKLLKDLESSAFNSVTTEPIQPGPTGVADPFK